MIMTHAEAAEKLLERIGPAFAYTQTDIQRAQIHAILAVNETLQSIDDSLANIHVVVKRIQDEDEGIVPYAPARDYFKGE